MNTASSEWAARVAARNEIETAKARQEKCGSGGVRSGGVNSPIHPLTHSQTYLLPLSAEGAGNKGTVQNV